MNEKGVAIKQFSLDCGESACEDLLKELPSDCGLYVRDNCLMQQTTVRGEKKLRKVTAQILQCVLCERFEFTKKGKPLMGISLKLCRYILRLGSEKWPFPVVE